MEHKERKEESVREKEGRREKRKQTARNDEQDMEHKGGKIELCQM